MGTVNEGRPIGLESPSRWPEIVLLVLVCGLGVGYVALAAWVYFS